MLNPVLMTTCFVISMYMYRYVISLLECAVNENDRVFLFAVYLCKRKTTDSVVDAITMR